MYLVFGYEMLDHLNGIFSFVFMIQEMAIYSLQGSIWCKTLILF